MRKSKFTKTQILRTLKEAGNGKTVREVCHESGISEATFYNWKSKYGGTAASRAEASKERRLNALVKENYRLKRMYADLALENKWLKDIIAKKQ